MAACVRCMCFDFIENITTMNQFNISFSHSNAQPWILSADKAMSTAMIRIFFSLLVVNNH